MLIYIRASEEKNSALPENVITEEKNSALPENLLTEKKVNKEVTKIPDETIQKKSRNDSSNKKKRRAKIRPIKNKKIAPKVIKEKEEISILPKDMIFKNFEEFLKKSTYFLNQDKIFIVFTIFQNTIVCPNCKKLNDLLFFQNSTNFWSVLISRFSVALKKEAIKYIEKVKSGENTEEYILIFNYLKDSINETEALEKEKNLIKRIIQNIFLVSVNADLGNFIDDKKEIDPTALLLSEYLEIIRIPSLACFFITKDNFATKWEDQKWKDPIYEKQDFEFNCIDDDIKLYFMEILQQICEFSVDFYFKNFICPSLPKKENLADTI